MKTVILDFVNVVADLDVEKTFSELSLKQKFAALRLYLCSLKDGMVKIGLQDYQKGNISKDQLVHQLSIVYPSAAKEIPSLIDALINNLTVNPEVLELVKDIRNQGSQVLLMSNSIPETEEIMRAHNLENVFNGIILSTEVKSTKPHNYIYVYAMKKYHINPEETIMIDDTKKNLAKAESLGIETFHCENSDETCEILDAYLVYQDMVKANKTNYQNNLI